MRSAAAKISSERILDVGLAWLRASCQEGCCLHDHTVNAIAALRRLFLDEGALHRVQIVRRAQSFERHDLAVFVKRGQRQHAGADRLAIEVHGTGAALRETASETRPV